MGTELSQECQETLRLLARSRNVLVSGPPGTGKSRLLAEVAIAFTTEKGTASPISGPVHDPTGAVPIPATADVASVPLTKDFPAPMKTDRKVFRTVFHQNSKYRDFVSGVAPTVKKTAGQADFRIIPGTLYRASEHAKTAKGASLLIIDEINRGPAVQVFGGSIVAIEADKRLAPDNSRRGETQFFELLDPDTGEIVEYAIPPDVYILAAMNQADASVEPLDVAFLRRWEPLLLEPNAAVLRTYYGLTSGVVALPDTPSATRHAFEASAQAWSAVNERISLGRGSEFQIGHGVLMSADVNPAAMNLDEALSFLCIGWSKVRAHVDEVFFGDLRGIAATLNALDGPAYNPLKLTETMFGDDLRFQLEGPRRFSPANIYAALRAIARDGP